MLLMCAEKVDRLCSMLCSSPMSARMCEKTGRRLPSAAGMCRPHWCIAAKSPIVLIETVLPPVLGPVMTRVSKLSPSSTSMGTAFA